MFFVLTTVSALRLAVNCQPIFCAAARRAEIRFFRFSYLLRFLPFFRFFRSCQILFLHDLNFDFRPPKLWICAGLCLCFYYYYFRITFLAGKNLCFTSYYSSSKKKKTAVRAITLLAEINLCSTSYYCFRFTLLAGRNLCPTSGYALASVFVFATFSASKIRVSWQSAFLAAALAALV